MPVGVNSSSAGEGACAESVLLLTLRLLLLALRGLKK
jgi:hypothetical protein